MNVDRDLLERAVMRGILQPPQAEALWNFLQQEQGASGQRSGWMTQILYVLGIVLAIGALTVFMTLGWQVFGGWGVMLLGVFYATAFFVATEMLRARKQSSLLIGWLAVGVVVSLPLAVFGLELELGWWEGFSSYRQWFLGRGRGWLLPELTLFGSALVLLLRYRLPVLMAPMILLGWKWFTYYAPGAWGDEAFLTLCWGLACLVVAVLIDLKSRSARDFAGWWYGWALVLVWVVFVTEYTSALGGHGHALMAAATLLIGVLIRRRGFVIVGGLGLVVYVGWLAWDVFEGSWLFPFILTALGAVLIAAGLYWQRVEARIAAGLQRHLPGWWPRRWLPSHVSPRG